MYDLSLIDFNIKIKPWCINLISHQYASKIKDDTTVCLQSFGINFKDNIVWNFNNVKISQNKSNSILIEIYIMLEKCGSLYGTITYFNDCESFYLTINIPKGRYVYDGSKDILTKATHNNYTDFIRKVEDAYSDIFDAEENWRKEYLKQQVHEFAPCPCRIVY